MKTKLFSGMLAVVTAAGLAVSGSTSLAQDSTTATTPQLSYGVSEVVKLSQAKASEDTILAFVRNSGNSYGLNADQIIYLQQQGVSSPVITAMLNQPRVPTLSSVPQPSTPAPQPDPTVTSVAPQTAPNVTYVQTVPTTTYYYSTPYYYSYPYYGGYYGYGYGYPALSFNFGWGGGWRGGHGGGWGGGFHGGGFGGGFHGGGGGFHGHR